MSSKRRNAPKSRNGNDLDSPQKKRRSRVGRKSALERLLESQPDILGKVINYIKLGAYDHVAAQALGVRAETFARWMRKGSRKSAPKLYRQFYDDISQAKAQARLLAEVQVKQDDPKYWLRIGPGRTKENLPGWTEQPDMVIEQHSTHEHAHTHSHQLTVTPDVAGEALGHLARLGLIQGTRQLTLDVVPTETPTPSQPETIIEPDENDDEPFDDYDD